MRLRRGCLTAGTSSTLAGSTSAYSKRSDWPRSRSRGPRLCSIRQDALRPRHAARPVITHRYEVLAKYTKSLRRTCAGEIHELKSRAVRRSRRAQALAAIDASALPDKGYAPSANEVLNHKQGAEYDLHHARRTGCGMAALERVQGTAAAATRGLVPARRGQRHRRLAGVLRRLRSYA